MTTNNDDTNVANNVVQPKVQDLTEQWKKGELKQGWYYIECIDLPQRWIDVDYYRNDCYEDEGFCKGFFDHNDWRGIDKVLAPVPSYEKWQELKEFADYSLHNRDELTRQINFWMDKHTQIEKENQQLKELLKECIRRVKLHKETRSSGSYILYDLEALISEIDNTIGEKK